MRTFWAQLGIWQSYYLREGSFLAPVIPIALRGLGTGKQAMAQVTTRDGVELFYEETGEGLPVVFVHEFAGDWRSWEPQVRYFSRRYRCINFNARGFPPSGVPDDPEMGFVTLIRRSTCRTGGGRLCRQGDMVPRRNCRDAEQSVGPS